MSKHIDENTSQEIMAAIFSVFNNNTLLSLSTHADDKIWTSVLFYAYDHDMNLYVITDPNSLHGKMIQKNPNVSGAIYSTNSIWGTNIQGIQFTGIAERVSILSTIAHGEYYLKRFPIARKFISSPELLLSDKMKSRLYSIKLKTIKIYDEINFPDGDPARSISVNQ